MTRILYDGKMTKIARENAIDVLRKIAALKHPHYECAICMAREAVEEYERAIEAAKIAKGI